MIKVFRKIREYRERRRENERIANENRISRDNDLYAFMENNPGTIEVIKSSWVREGDIIYQSEDLPPVQVNGLYWDGQMAMGSFKDHHGTFHHINVIHPERTLLWEANNGTIYRNPDQRQYDSGLQKRTTSSRRYESRYIYRNRR